MPLLIWPVGLILLAGCASQPAQITVHPQEEAVLVVLPNCNWNCEAVIELTTDNQGTTTGGSQSGGAISESRSMSAIPSVSALPAPMPGPMM